MSHPPARRDPTLSIESSKSQSPLAQRRSGLALFVVAAAQLMVVLDVTIVNVGLPSIQGSLGFSRADLVWVIDAYSLVFASLLLLGGRLGDLLGRRRVFMAGVGLFTVASLFGGFAQGTVWLLATRGLQGAGAAVGAATALSLISSTFSEGPARNRALGVYSAMEGGGASIGLLLGGVLVNAISWRAVFFVNVPVGLLILVLAPGVFDETPRQFGRFDVLGAVTAIAGLGLGIYGLTGAATRGWTNGVTVITLGSALALLATFVVVERRSEQPLMPLSIFGDRDRSGSYATVLFVAAALYGMFFFLTQFFQDVLHYSPLQSGLAFLPVSVGILAAAVVVSLLVARIGIRILASSGAAISAIGLWWLSTLDASSAYTSSVLPAFLVLSIGLGLTFVPITVAGVSGVRERDAGLASGVLNTAQQAGGALGVAILSTVFASTVNNHVQAFQRSLSISGAHSRGAVPPHVLSDALTAGLSSGLKVAAGSALAAAVISVAMLRAHRRTVESTPVNTDDSIPNVVPSPEGTHGFPSELEASTQ